MIRLAIVGLDQPSTEAIFARVRGACPAALDQCDAVAIMDSAANPLATAQHSVLAGRHVLLLADLARPQAEVDWLIGAMRPGGCRLAIVNLDRYAPALRSIKNQIDAGKLGTVGLVRIHFWEPLGAGRSLLPIIDLTTWFVDEMPDMVFAIGDDPDYAQVHLGFPGGAMALLFGAKFMGEPPVESYFSATVIGSHGAAYADDHHNVQLDCANATWKAIPPRAPIHQRLSLVQDFIDGLTLGKDFASSIDDWRRTSNIVSAAERSLQTRQAVPIGGS
jgi:predicted dehydrogenase